MIWGLVAGLSFVLALLFLAIGVWNLPIKRLVEWKKAKVRALEFGPEPDYPYYVRLTPNFGLGIPWFKGKRLRIAVHHGVQLVQRSSGGRWCVKRQLFSKSLVKGERFL
jgi:hypothetical protein